MSNRSALAFTLIIALLALFATSASAQVYIQEYCNDPYASAPGLDTNLDGVVATSASQSNDEFVEIVNAGQSTVDISGWTMADAVAVRHTFDGGTMLPGGCAIVIFGGGDVTIFNASGIATGVLASTGSIGLNNSSDTIIIADSAGTAVDVFAYSSGGPADGNGESITRDPESPVGVFTKYPNINPTGLGHCAGYRNDGSTAYCGASVAGVAYPGNGTDAALTISINGSVHNAGNNVHPIGAGDNVSFNCSTPLGGLNNGMFILAFYPFTTGSPAAPVQLPGDAAAAVWLAPSLSGIIVDGFSNPTALFAPSLSTWGFNYGPVNIPASMGATGTSIMLQVITLDAGLNSVNIGAADAHELEIQ